MMYVKMFSCIVVALLLDITPLFAQTFEQFRTDAKKVIDLINADKFDEAKPITERLIRLAKTGVLKDNSDVAEQLRSMGTAYGYAGRFEEAVACYRETIAIIELHTGLDSISVADELIRIGWLYFVRGNFSEAEKHYADALKIYEEKFDEVEYDSDMMSVLNKLANIYSTQGCYKEAELLVKRSLKIGIKNNDLEDVADGLVILAKLYVAQHRNTEAKLHYQQALIIYVNYLVSANDIMGRYHPYVSELLVKIAPIATILGEDEVAEICYKRFLEFSEMRLGNDHSDIVEPLLNLANIYEKQGQYSVAEQYYMRAVKICEKAYNERHPDTASSLASLAKICALQDRYSEAERFYKRALGIREELLGENHPDMAWVLDDLASFYYEQGLYAEAKVYSDRAIAIFETNPKSAMTGIGLFYTHSMILVNTDHIAEAVPYIKKMMNLTLEIRKQASGSNQQRAETFAYYHFLFEFMVLVQSILGDAGDINEVYEAMELSRARGLYELITKYMQPEYLFKGMPESEVKELLKKKQDAQIKMKEIEQQLTISSIRTDMDDSQKEHERFDGFLEEAKQRLDNAEDAIINASPNYKEFLSVPVSFVNIKTQLEMDKCLALQYLIGDNGSYLLVYGFQQEPTLFPLVIDETQAALFGIEPGPLTAEKLNKVFQNEQNTGILQLVVAPFSIARSDYPQLSRSEFSAFFERQKIEFTLQLHEKLAVLWPVLIPDKTLRDKITSDVTSLKRILILPDGVLAKFPFEMLVVNNDPSDLQYLLDKEPVTLYSPSARMYYNLVSLREKSDIKSVLTIGDPVYKQVEEQPHESVLKSRGEHLASRLGPFAPLPWSSSETEWVTNACHEAHPKIPVIRLVEEKSTEANVRNDIAGKNLAHFACHGLAEDEYGNMFGALLLTVGDLNDPNDDGFLELREIFNLDLKSCELVILSACNTNLGVIQKGEGTWALSRGMLVAGSRRVVTTNWKAVDDEKTAKMVSNYAKEVITSEQLLSYDEKLRSAKKMLRDDKSHSHPFFWASFVLVGTH